MLRIVSVCGCGCGATVQVVLSFLLFLLFTTITVLVVVLLSQSTKKQHGTSRVCVLICFICVCVNGKYVLWYCLVIWKECFQIFWSNLINSLWGRGGGLRRGGFLTSQCQITEWQNRKLFSLKPMYLLCLPLSAIFVLCPRKTNNKLITE